VIKSWRKHIQNRKQITKKQTHSQWRRFFFM